MNENTPMSKGSKKLLLTVIGIIILLYIGSQSIFFLEEGESALVQRFGRIEAVFMRDISEGDEVWSQLKTDSPNISIHSGTGLKFKVPFIDNVIKYPSKLILYESQSDEVLTLDKHRLYFDNSAQWRIENPLRFYTSFSTVERAKTRIDDRLYAAMRDSVGRVEMYALTSDRVATGEMLERMAENMSAVLVRDGISIVDIRIKRTDLPEETYRSIYDRMISERKQAAEKFRAEGEEESIKIRSDTDRQVAKITSEARMRAEEIRGQADKEAAEIYNLAYSADPEFFEFYNYLETYRQTVGNRTTMVFDRNDPFAKYLFGVTPGAAPVVPVPPPPPPPEE
jgi:membrane protease subunit HflC